MNQAIHEGIKVSIRRYGTGYSLHVVFDQEESRYASAGLEERSQRKLKYKGTLGNGLLLWFDHQGLSLKRTIDNSEPQLEGYVNVAQIQGKREYTTVIKPKYSRVTEDDRPAFRLDPLPELAEIFNPAVATPTPAQEAGKEILSRFEDTRATLDPARVAEIVRRHSGGGDITIGNHVPQSERPPAAQVNAAPPAERMRTAAVTNGNGHANGGRTNGNGHGNGGRTNGTTGHAAAPAETVEDIPEIPKSAETDLRDLITMLNDTMSKVDQRAIVLKVENNRLIAIRRKSVVVEEAIL